MYTRNLIKWAGKEGKGSLGSPSTVWQEDDLYDGENVGLRKGDLVPGGEAQGFQSIAFGGLRYDYASYNYAKFNEKYYDIVSLEPVAVQYMRGSIITAVDRKITIEGVEYSVAVNALSEVVTFTNGDNKILSSVKGNRKPTSALGNQAFAAGASVHAYGDYSTALNKDTRAYQKAGFVTGGGNIVGRTEDEFNEYFWDESNQTPLHGGAGKNLEGKVMNAEGETYGETYSFGFAAGADGKALGYGSTKLGGHNESIGNYSLTNGNDCIARASCQTVLGIRNSGGEEGEASIISGIDNTSNCYAGAVFGSGHNINGSNNLAGGALNTIESGTKNTILNSGNKIISGNNQYVGGYQSESSFSGAFLHGEGLRSSQIYQANFGRYNKSNGDALLIVGKGTSDTDRKNAFEVISNGIRTNEIEPIDENTVAIKGIINTYGNTIYAGDVNIKLDDSNWSSLKSKINAISSTKLDKSSIRYDSVTGVLEIIMV